jgi:hypothetical protein
MKKILSIFGTAALSVAFLSNQVKATDLVVAAGGAGGAYASLNAAIAAAANNDRIIVYPQPGGASYSEGTITITKSLQILSAVEGGYYAIDGNINIAPATAGKSVTIIGMKLFTGGIQSTALAPVGARCAVKLVNDSLMNGVVSFNHDNYDLTLANSYVNDNVTYRFGKVIGNVINGSITINTDGSVNNPNDTNMIIGNKILVSTNATGIYWNSTSQFFSIQNNFVYLNFNGYSTGNGINAATSKSSMAGTNVVTNNTIQRMLTPYYAYYGCLIQTNATSNTETQNNVVLGYFAYSSVYVSGGNHSVHYNYGSNNSWGNFTNDGTNVGLTNTTLDADGKITNVLSNAINGGNPDSAYVDINLTRNDAGCYGGSFTMDNFYPNGANDWARVFLVTAPRRVLVNGTISVKAIGYDK